MPDSGNRIKERTGRARCDARGPPASGEFAQTAGAGGPPPIWRRRARTMTANAALRPVPPSGDDPQGSGGAATMVRLIRESYAVVEPHAEEVARVFYGML